MKIKIEMNAGDLEEMLQEKFKDVYPQKDINITIFDGEAYDDNLVNDLKIVIEIGDE